MAKTNKSLEKKKNKSRPKHRDSGDTPKGQTSSGKTRPSGTMPNSATESWEIKPSISRTLPHSKRSSHSGTKYGRTTRPIYNDSAR